MDLMLTHSSSILSVPQARISMIQNTIPHMNTTPKKAAITEV